jgi:hypothetical protein
MARSPLMTQKAFADRIGKSAQYVNKLVNQGKIKRVGKLIDARQAKAAIAAFRRPGRVVQNAPRRPAAKASSRTVLGSKEPSATQNLTKWRAAREESQAKLAEIELQKATRALLPAAEVLEAERRKNANIRASFRRLARSLAPLLHRASSPAEAEQILIGEIDLVLSELARDPLGAQETVLAMPDPQPEMAPPAQPAAEMAAAQ